jgi:hypothetical protein
MKLNILLCILAIVFVVDAQSAKTNIVTINDVKTFIVYDNINANKALELSKKAFVSRNTTESKLSARKVNNQLGTIRATGRWTGAWATSAVTALSSWFSNNWGNDHILTNDDNGIEAWSFAYQVSIPSSTDVLIGTAYVYEGKTVSNEEVGSFINQVGSYLAYGYNTAQANIYQGSTVVGTIIVDQEGNA